MAVPKQKTSPGRRNKRRSHQRIEIRSLTACKNCGSMNPCHHICANCGFYNGVQMMNV